MKMKLEIRVDMLTKFCFFDVNGRPFEIPKKLYAHFVELERTKVLKYLVQKVKV